MTKVLATKKDNGLIHQNGKDRIQSLQNATIDVVNFCQI